MNENIVVLVNLADLPERTRVPAEVPEEHFTYYWPRGLEQGHKLFIGFPCLLDRNIVINVVKNHVLCFKSAEYALLLVEHVVFYV